MRWEMRILSTKLQMKDTFTQQKCLLFFKEWIEKSPHYGKKIIDYDFNKPDDYEIISSKATVIFRKYKDDSQNIFACRLKTLDGENEWYTDCIYVEARKEKFLLIQLNCNGDNYLELKAHKPHIIKLLIQSGFCKEDAEIKLDDKALIIGIDEVDLCAKIMKGQFINQFPIVYVSVENNDCWAVNADDLAKNLSGLAHVFMESSREISWILKDKAENNNAHNGYIGLYLPQTDYGQRYALNFYENDANKMINAVISDVWKYHIYSKEAELYNWDQIQLLQIKAKISGLEESKEDVQLYEKLLRISDSEKEEASRQIADLRNQNYQLTNTVSRLQEQLKEKRTDEYFYKSGQEVEFYEKEKSDLLFSILSQVRDKFNSSSRGYHIIEDLLKANPRSGECEHIIETVEAVFRGGESLCMTDKSKLKKVGFTINEEGKHIQLIFHDSRYKFTVSRTPSDHLAGKNIKGKIKEIINIERKIY